MWKETSFEEIQSFFARAILNSHNTLYAVGIKDTFSEEQNIIMCNYINRLLSYKNKSNLFLNSFIVIVCDKNNKNNISYLNKAIKHKKIENINIKHINLNNIINNVKVITSEVYGLGKSCQIKK